MKEEAKNAYLTYNKIASWFDEHRTRELMEKRYLDFLVNSLKPGASILDLGCGTGEPMLRFLVERNYKVLGVDASVGMLNIARERFPNTRFIESDMRALALNETFDAILVWHSFFHLPQHDQRQMFQIFARHMNPEGILMLTSGSEEGEIWSDNGGELLYHASLDTKEYRKLLEENHFSVIEHIIEDPECGGATVWIAQYKNSV